MESVGTGAKQSRLRYWLARPLQFTSALPTEHSSAASPTNIVVPLRLVRASASALSIVIPVLMMVGGLTLAVISAVAGQDDATEGIGAFGLEAGAALWFGGAITLGARFQLTRLRIVLWAVLALCACALIVTAIVGSWSGVALDLSMEFGVGLLAIIVIDVALLRFVHGGLASLAVIDGDAVRIRVTGPNQGARIATNPPDTTHVTD